MGLTFEVKRGTPREYPHTDCFFDGNFIGYYLNEGARTTYVDPFAFVAAHRSRLRSFRAASKKALKTELINQLTDLNS
jgi:hypothetical protein